MKHSQQPNQQQTQAQTVSKQMVQSAEILQMNRMDLATYVNRISLENPFVEMDVVDPFSLTQSNLSNRDVTAILEQTSVYRPSLYEFLSDQIHMLYRDTPLRNLIFYWMDQLDERGYVTKSIEEAVQETGATPVALLDSLTLLQQADPPGIGAQTIQDCLMLQVERMAFAPPLAYVILEEHYEDLIHKRWSTIADHYDLAVADVEEVFTFIQRLTTAPASSYESTVRNVPYVLPELLVELDDETLRIVETKFKTPLLTLRTGYYEQMKDHTDPDVARYVKTKKNEFDQMQFSLHNRRETVLKVGTAVLLAQQAYLRSETDSIQPLQLNDVAEQCKVSVSTISRAVRGTYAQTPRGVIELQSLLSRRRDNTSKSVEELYAMLQEFVDAEDKAKPLSDQKLEQLFKEKGITLSRRAIAKYRQALGIPSSTSRKIK